MAESSRATAHLPGSEPELARSLDLNRAAEVSGVALATYSCELSHLCVNRAYAALVGSEPENITGRPLADVLGSAALSALRPFIDQALRGERAQGTVRLPLAERWCTLCLTFTPQRSDGSVMGWYASFLDVTQEALEHEQLRESESTLRSFYSSSLCMMGVVEVAADNSELIHIYDSPSTARFLGAVSADLTGKTAHGAGPPPDIVALWIQKYRTAELNRSPVVFEYAHPLASGPRWLRCVVACIGPSGGGRTRFSYIADDITERKRSEQVLQESEHRFRNIADHAPVMIWVTDAAGHTVYINKAWTEYTGQSFEDVLGWGWLNALHPDDRERIRDLSAKAGLEPVRLEFRVRRVDGTYGWVIDISAPRFAANGEHLGYTGMVIDITEHKRMEQELQAADRRKDEFLATLAHELRNPLTPIRNAVQVLRLRGSADPAAQNAQEMIARQVSHMVRLIDDLLDVSRITRGKLQLQKEPVDLLSVLRHAVDNVRPDCDRHAHVLTLSAPGSPIRVDADRVRLVQVFANILDNACKYTPPQGCIDLEAAVQGPDVFVRVRDNGIGIPEDQLAAVFNLFTQVPRSTKDVQAGLGIGLSLVRSLVHMHGGEVEARSAGPGAGSEFIIRLPLLQQTTAGPDHECPPAKPAQARRVLVVDDSYDVTESMTMLLQLMGSDVETAHDGEEAVQKTGAYHPDVVLLDIGLPKMDGYEACRRIRAQPDGQSMFVVAVTGWGQEMDRRKSKEAGFDDHVVKPVDYETLLSLLARERGSGDGARVQ
jgi:PAS domain S-box-containing protein